MADRSQDERAHNGPGPARTGSHELTAARPYVAENRLSPGAIGLETFVVRKGVLTIALAWVAWQPAVAQKTKPENPAAKEVPSNPTTRVVEAVPAIPPSTDTLAAISRRGRALAVRDSIAWLGAAAMTSLSFPVDSIRRLIPLPVANDNRIVDPRR